MVDELNTLRLQLAPFFIEFGESYLHGDILSRDIDVPPDVLCLHGNAAEGRRSFLLLRQVLLEKYAISSCAFDFTGYGSTGGKPLHNEQYVQEYANQAADIIDACFDSQPFSIVAADSSIQVALRLAEAFPIRHLILLNPPAYWNETKVDWHNITMPAGTLQTLTYLNSEPRLLLKVATLVKDSLYSNERCGVTSIYKEYRS